MPTSPHLDPDAGAGGVDLDRPLRSPDTNGSRSWRPRRVVVTKGAMGWAHGRAIAARCAAAGLPVEELRGDQLRLGEASYAEAKGTLAVVVAPAGKLKLQPIAPSADWRVDLAVGCPAHCAYCYLAGSLKGAPVTRAYANLPEILGVLPGYLGQGTVTSRSVKRAHEGTTFEASCYTDPLGIEHLTGSLAEAIRWFGSWEEARAAGGAQLRFTTKFAGVAPLLDLPHGGATRMRASVNPAAFHRWEGGTARVAQRIGGLAAMARAGYPVGLTVAPIIAAEGWEAAYGALLDECGALLSGAADLTVELITHRYTEGSRAVLQSWYPGSALDMSGDRRAVKRTKFGAVKHVYDRPTMTALRGWFEAKLAAVLPAARVLYWT